MKEILTAITRVLFPSSDFLSDVPIETDASKNIVSALPLVNTVEANARVLVVSINLMKTENQKRL
jgi:hypothetical protein